jgi:hypothetical protein
MKRFSLSQSINIVLPIKKYTFQVLNLLMMKLLPFIFCLCSLTSWSQSAADYTVMLEAEAISETSLKLTWNTDANATGYYVYKKDLSSASWSIPIASLNGTDTGYIDNPLSLDTPVEYRLIKSTGSYSGYGYTHSGIKLKAPVFRGDILLIVEDSANNQLAPEISDLKQDLFADGWRVTHIAVRADSSASFVKSLVLENFDNLPSLQAVYLLGHVPVPYSGEIAPDAHTNHVGAWPADVFYAEMNGTWTDYSVSNTTASDPRNQNVPGDGKYDQSTLPSDVELMIGRVDFANLTGFSQSEMELLRRYLNRTHAYKNGEWQLRKRALIDDNFGGFSGEAFAASGWRNFSPLIGRDSIVSADYRTSMNASSYLFSYGCGGGSFTSAGGIGTSSDLAGDSLQTGFTMLFGSYFGDWDATNNFMRSALAQGTTMSISWAGRPHWYYQSMGMGYPIGYSAKLTQNNTSVYSNQQNYGAKWVHTALLGDPTLRMEYTLPPTNLAVDSIDTFHIALNWTASSDQSILGYNIYRSRDGSGFFKLNEEPISAINYTDSCVLYKGTYEYMVKAVSLIENFSGSYFNESLGAWGEKEILSNKLLTKPIADLTSAGLWLHFSTISKWATNIIWTINGEQKSQNPYVLILPWSPSSDTIIKYFVTVSNECESMESTQRSYVINGIPVLSNETIKLFPNPVLSGSFVQLTSEHPLDEIEVFDMQGALIQRAINPTSNQLQLHCSPGVYLVKTSLGGQSKMAKLIVQ